MLNLLQDLILLFSPRGVRIHISTSCAAMRENIVFQDREADHRVVLTLLPWMFPLAARVFNILILILLYD